MTITTLFMFLALAVGAGTNQLDEPTTTPTESITRGKIENNCYINGVWYNPCPSDPMPPPENDPDHGPQILLPN